MNRLDYRPFIPAPEQNNIAGPTPRAHAQARLKSPRVKELFDTWARLGAAPFADCQFSLPCAIAKAAGPAPHGRV